MKDIEIAKEQLHKEKAAITIVKDGKILFETRSHRISGFLDAIERFNGELENSSIADRVAGKAVALLSVYIKAKEIYSDVLSKQAKIVLDENGVICGWNNLVENILNSSRTGLCPFEKAAQGISNPVEAYAAFVQLQKKLR